ncbi:MAG: GNAT family N-acetyltransferase [candidate division WOR-3 bacterium]|nr:MAG: GNAT family N-acetyltransferase [candidate division WOR-3 bacterium]
MQVVDLTDKYFHFVSLCTHIDDPNEERDSIVSIRESWLREAMTKGLTVKVAIDEQGNPVGFAHCLPIELGAWGMSGKDLMTVPCLTRCYKHVYNCEHGSGIGKALMEAVETEAKSNKKGVAVLAYDQDFWFMHYRFFKKLGYKEVARQGHAVIMLKAFERVDPPVMHRSKYALRPVPGKIVVDAFWNPMCLTSVLEMKRVREACAQYPDKVILNEYNTWNKDILDKYEINRALFINGEYKCWGYAAPQDELKEEIDKALEKVTQQEV